MHTIQTPDAYRTLVDCGVLRGETKLAEPDYAEAYEWMSRRMRERLSTNGPGILWLWARIGRRALVDNCRYARGEVLLTVSVAHERVLLSDFNEWHMVLNKGLHIPEVAGESIADWSARAEPVIEDFESRTKHLDRTPLRDWPDELRAEIEASWDSIFEPDTWRPGGGVQAAVHELRVADVIRAVRIR